MAIEHQPCEGGVYLRLRIVFYAEPKTPAAVPKSTPDIESLGAVWCTFEEIKELRERRRLRSKEPYSWAKYLENGNDVHSLSLLKELG